MEKAIEASVGSDCRKETEGFERDYSSCEAIGNAGKKIVAPFGSVPGKAAKAQEVSCALKKVMRVF